MTIVHDGSPRALRLGMTLLRPGHAGLLLGSLVVVPVLLIAAVLLAIDESGGKTSWELLRAAWMAFREEPGSELLIWVVVVLAPLAVVLLAGQSSARIRVTSLGLQARIPRWLGQGLLGQTSGEWEVLWDAVRRVRLVPPAGRLKGVKRLGWYRLVIETDAEEIRVNPFAWCDPAGVEHRLRIGELLRPAAFDAAQRVEDAPLIHILRSRGFQVETAESGWKPTGVGFDLARHPGMLALLAVFFVAGLYALVDTFVVGSYRALEPLPVMPFIEVGAAAGAAAWLLGRGAPALERAVLGALAVAAVVAAVHPAMMRLNAATAEPEVVRYRVAGPGLFEPARERYPAMDLADIDAGEYWAAQPAGSFHEFTLLRGKAGFYQIDLSPLYARTRAFYESRAAE